MALAPEYLYSISGGNHKERPSAGYKLHLRVLLLRIWPSSLSSEGLLETGGLA